MIDKISLVMVFPEIILLVMACVICLMDLRVKSQLRTATYAITLLTLGVVAVLQAMYASSGMTHYGFGNMVVSDPMGNWLKCFATVAVMVTLVYGRPYAGQREAIFSQWQRDIETIARCPNVVAKLGGLAMPDNGFGWNQRDLPASSDELLEAQARYYHHAIACFGPERCLFESNFPVDKRSLPYGVYWNAMKKLAARYTPAEQQAMFHDNAQRIYRL